MLTYRFSSSASDITHEVTTYSRADYIFRGLQDIEPSSYKPPTDFTDLPPGTALLDVVPEQRDLTLRQFVLLLTGIVSLLLLLFYGIRRCILRARLSRELQAPRPPTGPIIPEDSRERTGITDASGAATEGEQDV